MKLAYLWTICFCSSDGVRISRKSVMAPALYQRDPDYSPVRQVGVVAQMQGIRRRWARRRQQGARSDSDARGTARSISKASRRSCLDTHSSSYTPMMILENLCLMREPIPPAMMTPPTPLE